MAEQYRCSVETFTSPPASGLVTTDGDVPVRAATTHRTRVIFPMARLGGIP
jgi:hypothetical protein